jgi:hypothetical protein
MNDPEGERRLLRIVATLLVLIIGSDLMLIIGRGIGCLFRLNCPSDDWRYGTEQISALLATVIALIFALIQGNKP